MRPNSVPAPASDEALVADFVLATMPPEARQAFAARLALEPELRRKVDEYRAELERLKATLPSVRPPDAAWASVEAELRRKGALDGIRGASAADQPPEPVGCTDSDS